MGPRSVPLGSWPRPKAPKRLLSGRRPRLVLPTRIELPTVPQAGSILKFQDSWQMPAVPTTDLPGAGPQNFMQSRSVDQKPALCPAPSAPLAPQLGQHSSCTVPLRDSLAKFQDSWPKPTVPTTDENSEDSTACPHWTKLNHNRSFNRVATPHGASDFFSTALVLHALVFFICEEAILVFSFTLLVCR